MADALKSRWLKIAPWAVGLLLLAALVLIVLHFGEIRHFGELAQSAQPQWLILAVMAQLGTYACAAGAWHMTLRTAGLRPVFMSLIPLSVAKLFTDQVLPTGGISGAILMLRGLQRRGIPSNLAMDTMIVSLVSYYCAYVLAVGASVALLWQHHRASPSLLIATAVFAMVAMSIPLAVLFMRRSRSEWFRKLLLRFPGMETLLQAESGTHSMLLRNFGLMSGATVLQLGVFLLDVLTFWIMFKALGQYVYVWKTFVAFATGSVAATLGPAPLGLGTFEAGAVTMLTILGVPIETALATTLLLRGMTFWLPMLPGFWLARREISGS